jgi:hypothetical protein
LLFFKNMAKETNLLEKRDKYAPFIVYLFLFLIFIFYVFILFYPRSVISVPYIFNRIVSNNINSPIFINSYKDTFKFEHKGINCRHHRKSGIIVWTVTPYNHGLIKDNDFIYNEVYCKECIFKSGERSPPFFPTTL